MSEAVSSAVLSACGLYRYSLSRQWGTARSRLLFVMLNPSTADACQDDPTIRRCIAFAKAWGYESLVVANLFALRSTNPLGLLDVADPVGPDNDTAIASAASCSAAVVMAHGTHSDRRLKERIRSRAWTVRGILRERGHVPTCLGFTKDRMPKHPLRLRGDLLPVPMT